MGRGRGDNASGGQSSLGYLFGGGETANKVQAPQNKGQTGDNQIAAGIHGNLTNNYHRADGQNCGNFITDRPSTKVHEAPGGRSSLGYLFGGVGN
ncbi:hypothetical protein ACOSP7_028156 [Xanthoceras sorbifolium]